MSSRTRCLDNFFCHKLFYGKDEENSTIDKSFSGDVRLQVILSDQDIVLMAHTCMSFQEKKLFAALSTSSTICTLELPKVN